jgi:hypothetical protein
MDHEEIEETGHYDVNLVNTVEDNSIKYSEHDYSKAVLACKVQELLEGPARRHFCPSWTKTCSTIVMSSVRILFWQSAYLAQRLGHSWANRQSEKLLGQFRLPTPT